MVNKASVALPAGELVDNATLHQSGHKVVSRSVSDANQVPDISDRDDGILIEIFKDSVSIAGGAPKLFGDDFAVLLA